MYKSDRRLPGADLDSPWERTVMTSRAADPYLFGERIERVFAYHAEHTPDAIAVQQFRTNGVTVAIVLGVTVWRMPAPPLQ